MAELIAAWHGGKVMLSSQHGGADFLWPLLVGTQYKYPSLFV
jgi:hypothetical protein